MKEQQETLHALFAKIDGGGTLTAEEKAAVLSLCTEYGVKKPAGRCKTCWQDAIVLLLRAIDDSDTQSIAGCTHILKRQYRGGIVVNGVRVSQIAMTDATYVWMRGIGLGHLFEE